MAVDKTPPSRSKKKRPARSKMTGRFVFCPHSNQHHPLFALEVVQKIETGNLWVKCLCGIRIHFDNNKLPTMTKEQAVKAGAMLPFVLRKEA
jgi:hypothetical protein